MEARAFANSDGTTGQLRLGRVQGLREAGVLAGYWRKRDSAAAAELVQHRYRLSKFRDVLLRGDEVKLWKVTDVAEFLGVSTQRVDQLALAGRFPEPSGRLGRARYWERSDVEDLGGGQLVGRGWPSLATQAIGERGSPPWKHPGVPGAPGTAKADAGPVRQGMPGAVSVMRYRPVPVVMERVRRSSPPNAQLLGDSGMVSVPADSPSGVNAWTDPPS